MGIATGETYTFSEGKLYLYASASGSTSGSGISFAKDATIKFSYQWKDTQNLNGVYDHLLVGRGADLRIGTLYADKTLAVLAASTAAVNAKFEGLVTGGITQSAQYILYSGVIDSVTLSQTEGDIFKGEYAMHANVWSAFGN